MDLNNSGVLAWDASGLLPVVNPDDPELLHRAPYRVSLVELANRFGFSEERRRLLLQLLEYRKALCEIGIPRSFQWIDGSFVEDVETLRGRSPMDIDLVTFYHVPEGHTDEPLAADFPHLFDWHEVNQRYLLDCYFMPLNAGPPEDLVDGAVYWASFWSYTRAGEPKGYVQLDLASDDEDIVRGELRNYLVGRR